MLLIGPLWRYAAGVSAIDSAECHIPAVKATSTPFARNEFRRNGDDAVACAEWLVAAPDVIECRSDCSKSSSLSAIGGLFLSLMIAACPNKTGLTSARLLESSRIAAHRFGLLVPASQRSEGPGTMPTNAAGGRSSAATKTKAARRNTSRSATASTTSSRSRRRTTIKGLKPSKSVTRKSADTNVRGFCQRLGGLPVPRSLRSANGVCPDSASIEFGEEWAGPAQGVARGGPLRRVELGPNLFHSVWLVVRPLWPVRSHRPARRPMSRPW